MKNIMLAWGLLFIVTCSGTSLEKVLDLDFSSAKNGILKEKILPHTAPAVVRMYSPFGRLRGQSTFPERNKTYASVVMGRSGNLDAVRVGTSGDEIVIPWDIPKVGDEFSIETWFYIYPETKRYIGVVFALCGEKSSDFAFRFECYRAKRTSDKKGRFIFGKGRNTVCIPIERLSSQKWHQVVAVFTNKNISLYVDGKLVGAKKIVAASVSQDMKKLKIGGFSIHNDIALPEFKFDCFTVYQGVLTAKDIMRNYMAGLPQKQALPEREEMLTTIQLEIPKSTYGYFLVNQAIPVTIEAPKEANRLVVNEKSYLLPLEEGIHVAFGTPGFYIVDLAVYAGNKCLKRVEYPVAIFPYKIRSSKVDADSLVSRQPEMVALGSKRNRVVVNWASLEPRKREYHWEELDRIIEKNEMMKLETVLCLTGIPRWCKDKKVTGSENIPKNMDVYRKLWGFLTTRYDDIGYFEIWNADYPWESMKGDKDDVLRDYTVLLKEASAIIREECPKAKILAGKIASRVMPFLPELIKDNEQYFDIVSFAWHPVNPAEINERTNVLASFRCMTKKPFWNTSGGYQQYSRREMLPVKTEEKIQANRVPPLVDESLGATWQIQSLALQFAAGVDSVFLLSGPSEYYPVNNATTGAPGYKGLALAVFNGLIGKNSVLARLSEPNSKTKIISFNNPTDNTNGVIVFSSSGKEFVNVKTISQDAKIVNMYGKSRPLPLGESKIEVSAQPIYILNATMR